MAKQQLRTVCPHCGADYSGNHRCSCQKVNIDVDQIPEHSVNQLARTVLEAARRAFEDPAFAAEFEVWRSKRAKK